MPTEVTHDNIQPTIDLTMGVYGRDLGHVSDDVTRVIERVRRREAARRHLAALRPVVEPQGDA